MENEWKMEVHLTIQNAEDESITRGVLYTDDDFGYYERIATVCATDYISTFRFSKNRMGDVLKFIVDESPHELEMYLKTVEGYEWIYSEHC